MGHYQTSAWGRLVWMAMSCAALMGCAGEDKSTTVTLSGSCAVGQYVQAINADGSLQCAAPTTAGGIGASMQAFHPNTNCTLDILNNGLGVFTGGDTQCGIWAAIELPDNVQVNRIRCRVKDVSADGVISGINLTQNLLEGGSRTVFTQGDASTGLDGDDILLDYELDPPQAVNRSAGDYQLYVYIEHPEAMAATLDEVGVYGCSVFFE